MAYRQLLSFILSSTLFACASCQLATGWDYLHEDYSITSLSVEEKELQRDALIKLFNSTDGPNWLPHRRRDWLDEKIDECQWDGVQCVDGIVRVLFLDRAGLAGTIPAEISNLKGLAQLFLAGNSLKGPIPESIGDLRDMAYLFLESNMLSGSIPSSIGNLSSMKGIWLEKNMLTGSIPPSIGDMQNLNTLFLDSNRLTGKLPSAFGNLLKLERLHLSNNAISGKIPNEIGNMAALEFLQIDHNNLIGRIPEKFSMLENIRIMYLENNHLTGILPQKLTTLPNLMGLNIHGNELHGTVPRELCGKVNRNNIAMRNLDIETQCNFIACPVNTFEPLQGRQFSANSPCKPCSDGKIAAYLGSTHCWEETENAFVLSKNILIASACVCAGLVVMCFVAGRASTKVILTKTESIVEFASVNSLDKLDVIAEDDFYRPGSYQSLRSLGSRGSLASRGSRGEFRPLMV